MNLIISFSGRQNGNCDRIAMYIARDRDQIIRFRDLHVRPCSDCDYNCFYDECPYRNEGLYDLYKQMFCYDRVILIVPMYGGNPSALYFIFNERSQDYFMHNNTYENIVKKLYIIGVYGHAKVSPDFIPCLEKWFHETPYTNRVLGIERHRYGQKLSDSVLNIDEITERIRQFLE